MAESSVFPEPTWIAAVVTAKSSIVVATEVSVVAVVRTPGVGSSATLVLINTPCTVNISNKGHQKATEIRTLWPPVPCVDGKD